MTKFVIRHVTRIVSQDSILINHTSHYVKDFHTFLELRVPAGVNFNALSENKCKIFINLIKEVSQNNIYWDQKISKGWKCSKKRKWQHFACIYSWAVCVCVINIEALGQVQ